VSKDAELSTYNPTNHNFANINSVPNEYGTSIYYQPGNHTISSKQNLYITNNLNNAVVFIFNYDGRDLTIEVDMLPEI
jgi:hypothetical protein